MAVRIAELEAKITADNRDFERKMTQSEQSAKAAASSIQRSFSGDPFKDFNKNIAKIDRQLKELERPRNIGGNSGGGRGGNFREAGQFLEELSRGDAVEALVQLSASAGVMGVAFAGAGIAIGGAVAGLALMTAHVIENVREVDKLAKDYKLTSEQVQGLQVVANLTGESVEDLAENYAKIGPEVRQFEDLVRSSGAAIDADMRAKTEEASLAWESFKLTTEGALNVLAAELLPVVTFAIRDMDGSLQDADGTVRSIGQSFRDSFLEAIAYIKEAQYEISMLASGLAKINAWDFKAGFADIGAAIKGDLEGQRSRALGQAYGVEFTDGGLSFAPSGDFGSNTRFPRTPSFRKSGGGKRKRGGGASDADATRRAQLELEKAQAAQLLALEQRRITEEMELLARAHEQKLLFIGDNLNAEIDEFNRYHNSRTSLQEQSIALEIENEKQLYYALDAEQKKAKKQSEKLRLETEKTRVAGRLDILRLEQSGVRGDEDVTRASRIRKAQEEQKKTAHDLAAAYNNLQSELVGLNGSDYDQYLQNLQRATKELQSLASVMTTLGLQSGNQEFIKRGKQAFDLLAQYTTAANQQFQIGQLGRDRQGLETGRGLQMDRINTAEDAGLITQGRAYEQRLQVQRAMKDIIVENLRAEQAILEALGKHNEALQVQREIEQAMVADFDVRARQRLVDFQDRLSGDFTGIIDELVSGTESVTDVLKNGLRNLILTTLKTMEETLVENLTGVKGGLGGMLGNVFGSLISGLFGGGSAFAGATASGFAGFAEGGHVMGGLPVRWNERGAEGELFVPEQSGYILNRRDAQLAVSNAASMRSGGNTTIINFHVTSQDGRITRESQSQAAAKLAMAMREAEARSR